MEYAQNRIKSTFLVNEKFFQKITKFVLTTPNRGAILSLAPRESVLIFDNSIAYATLKIFEQIFSELNLKAVIKDRLANVNLVQG
jgi:hypothetical protein